MFKLAWSKNGTPDTLSSSGDTIQITDLTAYKFGVFLVHTFATGGNTDGAFKHNGLSGSTMAYRENNNGGTDATTTSSTAFGFAANTADANDKFTVLYMADISGEEKLGISFVVNRNTAGAANAPNRREQVQKNATTTVVTEMKVFNNDSGDFDTTSNLSALGTD